MKNTYKIKTFTKITMTATIAVVFLFLFTSTTQAASKPRVTTMSASNIWTDSVVLNGQTDPEGSGTNGRFEWGLSRNELTNRTSEHFIGSGDSYIKFSALISGFSSNTKYYYRAVARNGSGVSYGSVRSFTTKKDGSEVSPATCSLSVETGSLGDISAYLAIVKGKINSKGSDTYGWFSYGKTVYLGSKTATEHIGNSNRNISIEKQLVGLGPGTVYYYQIVAENDCGIKKGNIRQLTTEKSDIIESGSGEVSFHVDTNAKTQTAGNAKLAQLSDGAGAEIEILSGFVQSGSLLVSEEITNTTFPNGTRGINSSFGGDIIEYTLLVKNIGIFPIYNVVVRDELSEQFDLVESIPDISYLSSGNSLIWNIELIKPSETISILLRVKAKPVEKSVLVFNNFTAETDEYTIVSKKIATVLNPALATPKVAVDEDGAKKGIVASVFSSVRDGLFRAWLGGLVFSLVLFIIIFFVFSLVFLLYKTQNA